MNSEWRKERLKLLFFCLVIWLTSVSRFTHSFRSVRLYSYYISLVTCPVDFNYICEGIRPDATNILYLFVLFRITIDACLFIRCHCSNVHKHLVFRSVDMDCFKCKQLFFYLCLFWNNSKCKLLCKIINNFYGLCKFFVLLSVVMKSPTIFYHFFLILNVLLTL